jgi:hypothetical protein
MMSPGNSPYLSTEKPDIPLREPLEEEGKSKRKIAREMLEMELKRMVYKNKLEQEEKLEKEAEELHKKLDKKLASAEKQLRMEHEKIVNKARAWENRRLEACKKAEIMTNQREKELKEKFKNNEKKRSATIQRKVHEK